MEKVLIIDDSFFQRKVLSDILAGCGCEVRTAESGRAGLEILKTESFDCILLDLLMPDISGLEVLEKLKNEGLQTPVIVVSADIQETVKKQCMEAGAFGFVNKPPQKDYLQNIIRQSFTRTSAK